MTAHEVSRDLGEHLGNMQDKALLIENLMAVLCAAMADPARSDLCLTVIEAAEKVANEINCGLDSVSLHKARAA